MARLLDDLLDIARITQGKLTLRRQRVPSREFIDSALESVRPLIEHRQHILDLQLPADPPVVHADPIRMSQVVANLLANAAKYTEAGGRITLATRVENEALVIEVRDNGIGIPPHALPGLFDMFSKQPGASERSEGGLGVGLSLVRDLMDLHVLDIGMPKLNGYEVAKALRREPWAGALVLVAATGWGDADARRKAIEAGFDKHLTKPVGPEELQEILEHAGR